MSGIIGRKLGMTQIFDDVGALIPVTVIEAGPCPVMQVKTDATDGYSAIQIGYGARHERHAIRAERGHALKAGLEHTPATLAEFRVDAPDSFELGQELTVEQFEVGVRVKVAGTTKGRGFQGVVKRHGYAGRPASHGQSGARIPGSLGAGTDPSRVVKGKKLPGRMGGKRHTERNLRVERIDAERNLIFVRGAVPGSRNSLVYIRKA
jgi:large subunit ribosomal protein L3